MNTGVIPTFETHMAKVETVLSDDGREFCGRPDQHRYELFLPLEKIEHPRRAHQARQPLARLAARRTHAPRMGPRLLEGDGACARDLEQARRGRADQDHHCAVGFFNLGHLAPHQVPVDIDDRLDEDAASILRILVLRKLARIREAASRPAPLPRRNKVGRNDPCRAAQARNTSAAAVAPDPSNAKSLVVKKPLTLRLSSELRKRP